MSQINISTTNTAVNTNSSATLVYLPPAATASTNTIYFIQDATGNAANSTIYIYTSGADTLDNQVSTTALLQTNYASIYLSPDGVSNWMVFKAALQVVSTGFPQGVYIAFVYPNVVTVWSGSYTPYTVRFYRNASASTSGGTLVETATASANTQTSTVLLVSNQYYYSIITYNGNSTTSTNFTEATLLPYRPLAPFIAFVYPNLVVTWKSSLQTTTYTVAFYRSATVVQTFTNLTTLATTSTVKLTNASYYAIITAVNRYGSTSTQTPTVQATLIAAPSSATLTLYFTALTVTWTASLQAKSYTLTLYYNSTLYATITTTATTYSTTPNFFGTYYATVAAINTYGSNSITTNTVTYSTQAPVITVLTQGSGNNALYFTWSSTNTTSWNLVVEIVEAGQQLPFTTLNGITNQGGGTFQTGQPVFFTATLNVTGPGGTTKAFFAGFSGNIQSNPPTIVRNPTPVTSPTITLSDSAAICSWTPVADATSYTVVFYQLPGSTLIQSTSAITVNSITSPPLVNNYSYYATVISVSANAYSSPVPTNTTAIINNPPSPITAASLSLYSLYALASWSGSVNATSYSITFYQNTTQTIAGGAFFETDTTSATTQLSVNQLIFGNYYYAIITPSNVYGKAAPFTTQVIGVNSSPPNSITSVFTISINGLYAQCTWLATTYASYYTVTFYQNTTATLTNGTVFETDTTTGTSQITSKPLLNEYYYYATITASNQFGTSPLTSSGFTTLIIKNVPTTPTNFLVTFSGTQVTGSWSASINGSTYTITFYQGTRSGTSGGLLFQTNTTSQTTSATTTTLLNGYYYYGILYANNTYGSSTSITSPASVLVSGIAPSPVSLVTITFAGTQATATWSAPLNTTSYTVVFYQVATQVTSGGSLFETDTATILSQSTSTALVNGYYYYASVASINAYGTASSQTSSTAVLSAIPPFTPSNATISFTGYSVTASWVASNYATSYTVIFYQTPTAIISGGSLFETDTPTTTTQTTTTTLVNAAYYYARITANNTYGISATITTATAVQARAAPVSVTNVTLVNSGLTAQVSWTASSFSTTYQVFLYQVSSQQIFDGSVFEINTGILTTSKITTNILLNGYYYYASVIGVNQFTSGVATTVTAALGPIANIPTVPTNVTVSFASLQITASWSASINATSYTVNFYKVATRITTGGALLETDVTTSTSQASSAILLNGYYYYATVTANNIYGSSAAATSTTPILITTILPSPASNVAVSFAGTSITATWTASPENATGYSVIFYETPNPTTSGGAILQSDTNITETTRSTSLVLLNNYYYYAVITAINANGSGPAAVSASTTNVVTGIYPTLPSNIVMSFAGIQATVTWTASYRNANSYTVNFYEVATQKRSDGVLFETDTGLTTLTQTIVTPLNYNQYYYATVTADGTYGSSVAVVSINAVVAGFIPLAPTNVVMSFAGTQLTASWTPGSYVATYTTTFYQIATPVTTGGTLFETDTGNTGTSQSSSTVLVNGTYYYAIVTSVNPYGRTPATSATTTDQITTILPTNPSNVAVSFAGTQVTATWTGSLKNATSYRIVFYQIGSATPSGGSTFETDSTTSLSQATSTVLVNGTYYYATVTGVNINGNSSSITSATTTPLITTILPTIPSNVAVSFAGTQVTATWTASAKNATSYIVLFYQVGSATTSGGTPFETDTPTGTTQLTSTVLVNGTYYYATVTGKNVNGNSAAITSATTTPLITTILPTNPSNVAVSFSGTQVTATWTASLKNATSYSVVFYQNGSATTNGGTTFETTTSTGATQLTSAILLNGYYYYATVTGVNANGNSSTLTSASTTAAITGILPSPPTNVSMSMTGLNATVSWTAGSFNVLTYTIVFYQNITATTSGGTSFQTITGQAGLTQTSSTVLVNTYYYYAIVTSVNAYDSSSSATTSSNTTIQIANPPLPPTSVSIALSGNKASVSWSAVTNATTYTVVIYNPTTNTTTGGTVLETDTGLTGVTTLSVNTLTSGQYYYATVTAVNTYGSSSATTSGSAIFASILPTGGAISLSSKLYPTSGSVTLTQASGATGYTVYISPTTSTSNSVYSFTTSTTGLEVSFTPSPSLTANSSYYAIMIPNNQYGTAPQSISSYIVTGLYIISSTITFTPAGATGSYGPTLSQCKTAYSSFGSWVTNTAYFNMTTQGNQLWTVPVSGIYKFVCAGSGFSGNGAVLTVTISLTQGHIINIVVGQSMSDGSGSGGSFVYNTTTTTILLASGGSGGKSTKFSGGSTDADFFSGSGSSGTNGNSQTVTFNITPPACSSSWDCPSPAASSQERATIYGGKGGLNFTGIMYVSSSSDWWAPGAGGFGGGGFTGGGYVYTTYCYYTAPQTGACTTFTTTTTGTTSGAIGGGGGGYSGGNGGEYYINVNGGGGHSYSSPSTNYISQGATNIGQGYVSVTLI